MPAILTIRAGDSICTLCPELGGSILSWQVGGQNMLRQTSDAAIADRGRLGFASFPLVPYSNRIGQATFEYNGRRITLAKNFAPEPNALHGTGWEDIWQADMAGPDRIIQRLSHPGDDRWPWAFDAEQVITILPHGLHLELSAHNRSDEVAPLAFGHHPYFDQAGASMQFIAPRVWMSGEDGLPAEVAQPNGRFAFEHLETVEGRDIDHCYTGWSGQTRIEWAGREHALEIMSPMRAAVVYIPKGGDAFCFEPVPHVNNALNMPGAEPTIPAIAPDAAYHTAIVFNVVAPRSA